MSERAVLISIQPKWCEKIANCEKTIEVRKTRPKIETPFKCYIYMTKNGNSVIRFTENGNVVELNYKIAGKVIGEFVCDWITEINPNCDIDGCVNQYIHGYPAILGENDCLSFNDMKAYLGTKKGYDWHISDLKIYEKPKELSEFKSVKVINRYHKKEYDKYEKLSHSHRVQVTYFDRPPQSWRYVEPLKENADD